MIRAVFSLLALTMVFGMLDRAEAGNPNPNNALPKVDYQVGRIRPLGQGLAIPVKNGGFVMSPKTTITVSIYERRTRRLLESKTLTVPAMHPNQTRRIIFVPPSPRQPILVRAKVDPRNQVQESNERNNEVVSNH